jgi:taurine dioxygenase
MEIKRIAGALGATLTGIDLLEPPSPESIAALRAAWLAHKVIFLPRQPLSPAQFLRFAKAVGQPVEYPFVKGIEGFPEIIEVKKLEHERVNFGGVWHSDTTYLAGAAHGHHAAVQGHSALWRRHAVCQPSGRV